MTPIRPRSFVADFAPPALLALATVWLMRWDLYLPQAPYDDGIRATSAWMVQYGRLPYRDFYCIYGFGEFYLGAGLLAAFGHSLTPLRVARIASQVGLALAAYALARRLSGSRLCALIAGGLTIPLVGSNCNWGLIPVFASLCALHAHFRACAVAPDHSDSPTEPNAAAGAEANRAAETCAPSHAEGVAGRVGGAGRVGCAQRRARARLVLCGVLLGLAAWFRPDLAAFAGAAELSVLLFAGRTERPGVGWGNARFALALTWFAAAALTAALGYAPFLVLCPADLWRGLVEIPIAGMPGRRLPFPPLAEAFFSMHWAHVFIGLTAAGWLVLRRRSAAPGDAAGATAAATCLLCMLTWFYAAGRSDAQHQMPSLALASVLLAWLLRQGLRQPVRPTGAALCIAMAAYAWMSLAPLDMLARLAEAGRSAGAAPRCGLTSAGLVRFDDGSDQIRAVQRVRRDFPGERSLFVGLQRHDRIHVSDAMFYFLAEQLPAVRDLYFDPLITNSEPIQQRMIADLERERPAAAVLWRDGSFSDEPNGSAASTGVRLLDQYLQDHYLPVETIGAYEIRRRTSAPTGG